MRWRLRDLLPLQSPLLLLWLLPGFLWVAASPDPRSTPRPPLSTPAWPSPGGALAAAGSASSGNATSSLAAAAAPAADSHPRVTQRTLSVLVLASAALIVYFVIRTVRLRRRNRKTRRYGVLDTNIGNMELTPLEQDDDDDDTTLFDANHPRR
ncbi:membrane protein FAM174A [Hemicordylus capensis]|uniref:membrane protein FAM174A n=1 Tax=Hemicordylus capensis TaxID=884348 RepID=UPI002302EA3F|nr:membrane protein FAM174A [Hemicordylus capensis]